MADEDTDQQVAAEEATQESIEQQAEREEAEGRLDDEGNAVESGEEQGSKKAGDDAAEKEQQGKTRVQKRIDELTKQRHEALREAEQLREENRKLKESQSVQPPADDPRPNFDDYDSVQQFERDLESWARRQNKREAEAQPAQPSGPSIEEQQAIDRVQNAAVEAADRYSDFEEVVYNPNLPLTSEMLVAASETDSVADVLYHLGKNPQEAQRLSQMSGTSLVREMGRLEARLEAGSGNGRASQQPAGTQSQQTSAPEPINTVGATRSKREPRPSEMSTDEFIRWRNKQEQERRQSRRR